MRNCDNCIHNKVCDQQKVIDYKTSKTVCKHFKEEPSVFDILPSAINSRLWKIVEFHRNGPKVSEYIVKNIRMVGENHEIQVEAQAVGVPLAQWTPFKDFFKTKEDAEEVLRIRKGERSENRFRPK